MLKFYISSKNTQCFKIDIVTLIKPEWKNEGPGGGVEGMGYDVTVQSIYWNIL